MAPFLDRDVGRAQTAASESERVRLAALAEKRSRPFSQRTGGHGFAESYTVADDTSQWQFLGGEDEMAGSTDRPATRRDAALLRRRYEQALRVLRQETGDGDGLERAPVVAPDLEQDLRAMREEATSLLRPLENAASLLAEAPTPPDATAEGALGAEPVTAQAVAEDVRALAASRFQQKWTDLTLGRIMSHVGVAFSELGDLLRLVRSEYARSFSAVAALHHRTALREAEATALAASLRARLAEHGEAEAERARHERARRDEDLKRLKQRFEGELEAAQLRVDEALDREERASAGLRALDDMVQGMRGNADASRVIDLRDASVALQRRLEDATRELKQLRPLKAKVAAFDERMGEKDGELASARKELAATRRELDEQKQLCNDLLQREQSRLAAMEEARAGATAGEAVHEGEDEDGAGGDGGVATGGEGTESSRAMSPTSAGGGSPSRHRGPIRRVSSSATADAGGGDGGGEHLCIRCGRQLDRVARMGEVARAEDRLASREARGRPVCRAYRSLLPNLQNFEPQRSARWVLARLRAIMASYADEHVSAVHSRRLRARFPEFVHAWFAPPHRVLADCTTRAAREALHARADEQRWALYYGCRDLARGQTKGMRDTLAPEGDNRGAMAAARALEATGEDEDEDDAGAAGMPEARLFFTLLDEQMGEDSFTFLVHTWNAVQAAAGSAVQYGVPAGVDCDHDLHIALKRARDGAAEAHEAAEEGTRGGGASWLRQSENQLPAGVPGAKAEIAACEAVPLFVWLMLEHAAGAVRRVLARATETERASVLKAVVDAGVSTNRRVPEVVVRTTRSGQGPGRCADLSVFFALILREYRHEQSQRRAATRLMFHSALDALRATPGVGLGGPAGQSRGSSRAARTAQPQAQRSLDLQRFAGILATLNSRVTPPTILALYRDAFELGGGVVDYQAFVDVAERRQFFSSCLRLPMHAPAEGSEELTPAQRTTLDNIVRFHAQIVRPAVQVTLSQVYSADREHGLGLLAQLEEALYSGGGSSGTPNAEPPAGGTGSEEQQGEQQEEKQAKQQEKGSASGRGGAPAVDGRRALWTYRRLLVFLLQLRARSMERIGDGGGGMAIMRVEREIEGYIRLLRESAQRSAEVLATENRVEETWRSVALVARTRKNLSVVRIQRMWRVKRQARAQFPRLLRACLSTHFARSGPRPQGRVAVRPLPWLLAFVSTILAAKARSDTARAAQRLAPTPLQECVYDVCLSIAGVRRVAERLVHDLISATYRYWGAHPRAQLFGLLLGMQPPSALSRSASSAMALLGAQAPGTEQGDGEGSSIDESALTAWFATPQAVVYATEALVAVWQEMQGMGCAPAAAGDDTVPLFPPSNDQEQCQVPLLAVVRAFDRVHPPASEAHRATKGFDSSPDAAPMPRYLQHAIKLASTSLAEGREASRENARQGAAGGSAAAGEDASDSASVGCLSALEGENDADSGEFDVGVRSGEAPVALPRQAVPEAKDPTWATPRVGARRLSAERFLKRMLHLAFDAEDGDTANGPVVDLDAVALVWMFEWATAAERATLDLSATLPPRLLLFDGVYSVLERATRKHGPFFGEKQGSSWELLAQNESELVARDPLAAPLATRLATQKRGSLDALEEELKLVRATAQQGAHAMQSDSKEDADLARRLDRRWSEAEARYRDAFQFGAIDPRFAAKGVAREAALATPFAAQATASSTDASVLARVGTHPEVLFALVDHTWRPYQGAVREALQRLRMELNAQLHVVRDGTQESSSPRAVGSPGRVYEAKGILSAVSTWMEALDRSCQDPGARRNSRGVNAALGLLPKVLTGILRCRKLLGVSRQFDTHHIADQWD